MGNNEYFRHWRGINVFTDDFLARDRVPLFFAPRLAINRWSIGAGYVLILTIVTPTIGIAMTITGVLAGQVCKSLLIDHFGWFGSPRRKIDRRRVIALLFIVAALVLIAVD